MSGFQSKPQKLQGDRINARFLVDIDFNSNQKATHMRGYSKFVGKPEAIDPARSLHGFVSRLISNGYLDRSYFMEFRTNTLEGGELLLQLTPSNYELFGAAKFYLPLEVTLNQVFTLRKNGGDYLEILQEYRQQPKTKEKDLFSFQQGKFKNEQELRAHCQKLFHQLKFPLPRVEGFFNEYRKHFDNDTPYENPVVTNLANNFNANRN